MLNTKIGDVYFEFGIGSIGGSTRVITLAGNYTELLYFDLCYTATIGAYPPREIKLIAPNKISFIMQSASGPVTYDYSIPYIFVGRK